MLGHPEGWAALALRLTTAKVLHVCYTAHQQRQDCVNLRDWSPGGAPCSPVGLEVS